MSKEAEDLFRLKGALQQYQRWLAEFPDVALVLDNLVAVAEGKSLCASRPPSSQGPWSVSGLRDTLRARRADTWKTLNDARLTWGMVCECDCKECRELDVAIRAAIGPAASTE